MRAEIISVGTELLLGDILNTNAQFLARELASLGFSVFYQTVVGDNAGRLRDFVSEAKNRSDILIFTGGLGPTDDDLTKETVAEAFGDTLVLDEEELDKLHSFFTGRGQRMTENNVKQAMVPKRGRKLPNANGTAPGAYFRQGSKYAILLPGPPREMEPMFREQVLPILESLQDSTIRSLTLHVFGIGESALETRIAPLLEGENPTAALYAKTGEVFVRITAKAPTAELADMMCEEYAAQFRAQVGEYIYSENGDGLAAAVIRMLKEEHATLATAESCTGGMLSERLTAVPGASTVFGYGHVTYANAAKHQLLHVRNSTLRRFGAVSSQVAAEMAFGAARSGGADYGIGITGVAGPDGGTVEKPVGLVYIALAHGSEVYVKKMAIGNRSRDYVRELAVLNALDMLRRALQGYAIPSAKRFTKGQLADYDREGPPIRRGGSILRNILAVLVVALLLVLLVVGIYYGRQNTPPPDTSQSQLHPPSAAGLVYGTADYTAAACNYVAQMQVQQPDIVGMVALPDGMLEQLVAEQAGQADDDESGLPSPTFGTTSGGDFAHIPAGVQPTHPATNTLVSGGAGFAPLLQLAEYPQDALFFSYFTSNDAREYQIFAVYWADDAELATGSFLPGSGSLTRYADYLGFVLGNQARSLYGYDVDTDTEDTFMTLAVPDADTQGRSLYVCGRQLRTDESATASLPVSHQATALMPAAWYKTQNKPQPAEGDVYSYWLRWNATRGASNSMLQFWTPLAQQDAGPWEIVTLQPAPALPGSSSSQAVPSSSSGSESTSADADSASASDAALAASNTDSAQSSSASAGSTSSSSGSDTGTSGSDDASDSSDASGSSASVASSSAPPRQITRRPDATHLTVTMNGAVTTDTTANILAQVCQREGADLPTELIKALAVAAHSWILNCQGAGDPAPAVVGSPASPEVLAAVREVEQLVVSADGSNPAFCPWTQMGAFSTNTAEAIWGVSRAYLSAVPTAYEQGLSAWRQIITLPQGLVAELAQAHYGMDLAAYGEARSWFAEPEKNESGYVLQLQLGGQALTGYAVWSSLLTDVDGNPLLPSPAFEVNTEGEDFVFICHGSGHGCGLSLVGAANHARQGWNFERILQQYYPGTSLLTWA